jgi:hypothetical protein
MLDRSLKGLASSIRNRPKPGDNIRQRTVRFLGLYWHVSACGGHTQIAFEHEDKCVRRGGMPKYQKPEQNRRKRGLDRSALFLIVMGIFLAWLPGRAQEEEEEEFKGVGIHIRLYGAWVTFSGGDLAEGTAGMHDRTAAGLSASGFELTMIVKESFTSGYEMGGDIVYWFTPRVGVGFGGSLARSDKGNSILFNWPGRLEDYMMNGVPELKVFSLRVGLFMSLPLNRWLTFCASAGPAWHFAEFRYTGEVQTPVYIDHIHQEAKASHWGVQGGIGLEIRMNRRLAFILAAMGRYATVSGFDGKEVTDHWEDYHSVQVYESGTLYLIEGEEYPRLDIIQGPLRGDLWARKADFDFSGLRFQAGLNFKF